MHYDVCTCFNYGKVTVRGHVDVEASDEEMERFETELTAILQGELLPPLEACGDLSDPVAQASLPLVKKIFTTGGISGECNTEFELTRKIDSVTIDNTTDDIGGAVVGLVQRFFTEAPEPEVDFPDAEPIVALS